LHSVLVVSFYFYFYFYLQFSMRRNGKRLEMLEMVEMEE